MYSTQDNIRTYHWLIHTVLMHMHVLCTYTHTYIRTYVYCVLDAEHVCMYVYCVLSLTSPLLCTETLKCSWSHITSLVYWDPQVWLVLHHLSCVLRPSSVAGLTSPLLCTETLKCGWSHITTLVYWDPQVWLVSHHHSCVLRPSSVAGLTSPLLCTETLKCGWSHITSLPCSEQSMPWRSVSTKHWVPTWRGCWNWPSHPSKWGKALCHWCCCSCWCFCCCLCVCWCWCCWCCYLVQQHMYICAYWILTVYFM